VSVSFQDPGARKEATLVNLSSLTDKAKNLISRRGGTESLKEDAEELKDTARSQGSASDKPRRPSRR
jgi:hypothetical protein